MVIISKTKLNQFGQIHPEAVNSLDEWYKKAKQADWGNLAEVKQSFGTADYVGNDRFVFNLKGNRYRLVAMIFFDIRTVFIRFVGTHSEYDRIDCSTI